MCPFLFFLLLCKHEETFLGQLRRHILFLAIQSSLESTTWGTETVFFHSLVQAEHTLQLICACDSVLWLWPSTPWLRICVRWCVYFWLVSIKLLLLGNLPIFLESAFNLGHYLFCIDYCMLYTLKSLLFFLPEPRWSFTEPDRRWASLVDIDLILIEFLNSLDKTNTGLLISLPVISKAEHYFLHLMPL